MSALYECVSQSLPNLPAPNVNTESVRIVACFASFYIFFELFYERRTATLTVTLAVTLGSHSGQLLGKHRAEVTLCRRALFEFMVIGFLKASDEIKRRTGVSGAVRLLKEILTKCSTDEHRPLNN